MGLLSSGRWWMGAAAAAALSVGCGEPTRIDEAGKDVQTKRDPTYPDGPYGYAQESVIADFQVFGRVDLNDSGDLLDDTPQEIWLSDYRKNNKVIVVTASAEWCAPCNAEQPALVAMHKEYKEQGVAFLEALVQDKNYRESDDPTLQRWAKKHKITFDLALDPTGVLQRYYDINAFPFGMVIRTSDMKIVWLANGAASDAIERSIELVLAE